MKSGCSYFVHLNLFSVSSVKRKISQRIYWSYTKLYVFIIREYDNFRLKMFYLQNRLTLAK